MSDGGPSPPRIGRRMRLHLGPNASPRLLAAGLPDWLGADGMRVGWALRDVLFWFDGDAVQSVRLPDVIEEVSADPAGWTVAMALGAAHVDLAAARITSLLSVDEGEPLAVLPGREAVVVVSVPESSLVRVSTGSNVPIPDAATRARFVAPFADAVGLVWIDRETLFRLTEGGIVHALGRAPGAEALVVGPRGSTLVALDGDTLCAAPRALPGRLGEPIDVEGARFSPDGALVLAATDEGCVEIEVASAKVLRRWEGAFVPVGYAPGPVRWDRSAGTLLDADGAVLARGFTGASASLMGGWLVGPGGAVWDVQSGEAVRQDVGEGTAATDGVRVVVADDTEVRVLDGARFPHGLGGDDDGVDLVHFAGATLTLQTFEGHAAAFSLDGAEHWRADRDDLEPELHELVGVTLGDSEEPSETTVRGATFELPADGAVAVNGKVWVWTNEGMLVEVG